MAELKLVRGSELEERLSQIQLSDFKDLMYQYCDAIAKENPALFELDAPYGVKDVVSYLGLRDIEQFRERMQMAKNPYSRDRWLRTPKGEFSSDCIFSLHSLETCTRASGVLTFREVGDVLVETHLVVGDGYEGKGIGKALLKEFIEYGKRNDFREARIHNFTVGGYATFRKVEQKLNDPTLAFENISIVKYGESK